MTAPLYLTFDDGPDPDWTPRVLDTLARFDARATFFVLGWRLRQQPTMVADLLAAGHRVELHGDAHLDHEIATREQLVADTDATLDVLEYLGVAAEWWRVPFGRPGLHTAELAAERGLRIVGWDVDTTDWRGDGWAQQPAQVSDAARDGGVVLLHDAVAHGTPRADAENTLEVTSALLQAAARHGTRALALPPASTDEPIRESPRASPFARSRARVRAALDRHAV